MDDRAVKTVDFWPHA